MLKNFKNRFSLALEVAFIHINLLYLVAKFNIIDTEQKNKYPLSNEMKRAYPITIYSFNGDMEQYAIIGTAITIHRRNDTYSYTISISDKNHWLKPVNLEYILENYPEKITKDFIFNMDHFK